MAYVVGTGAAFGNHYTTEQMKEFFKTQREAAGDTEFDVAFMSRVLDACGFEYHSVALPEKDVFRRMSRSEYLEHRMTNLVEMAQRAAEEALALWGGDRSKITHFYWGTMTGAMHSPTIDIELTGRLGLSGDVARTSIEGMGCLTGYRLLNLGRVAALSDPDARVLCLEGDLRSAIGNSLRGKASKATEVCGMSRIVPDSRHYVDYRELDDGAIRLHLDKGLPAAVGRAEPAFANCFIEKATALGFEVPPLSEMDIACHTGGPRVLQEVAQASGVDDEALASSYAVMTEHGNLSGASNMAVLDHHNRGNTDEEEDGKWVLCISMGPGVCIEGALLRRMNFVEEPELEVEEEEQKSVSWSLARSRTSMRSSVFALRQRKSTFVEMSKAWNEVAGEFGSA